MLTRPGDVQDAAIVACLAREYGLPAARVTFLPLGADVNTAVYRAEADEGQGYLVKLRRGAFDEVSVTLPRFLRDQGIAQVIPPLPTTTGRISATLGAFQVILYPFSRVAMATRSRCPSASGASWGQPSGHCTA